MTRPDRAAVEAALRRVLASTCFEQAERHKQLLEFIVTECLAGRGEHLKGYNIGLRVFDRPADFDAQSDPLVRVEAGRLRSRLAQYYASEGCDDPIRILIPKGGYQPEFSTAETTPAADRPPKPGGAATADADGTRSSAVSSRGWAGGALPDEPAAVASPTAVRGSDRIAGPVPPASGQKRSRRLLEGAGVVTLLIAAALLVYFGWQLKPPVAESEQANLALPDWPSIYVAPLVNIGTDERLDFFARGIGEEIMLSLRDYELIVIVGELDGPAPDRVSGLLELRRRLDVDYVLAGSVRNDGERIRIVARLADTRTGEVLWSGDSDQPVDVESLIAVETRMAQEIVRAIAGPYGPIYEREFANLKRARPRALETYNCLLRYYDYRRTVDVLLIGEVTACFEEAVLLEPGYAEAWAGLSLMLQEGLLYGDLAENPGAALARAREAARQGLDIDGNSVLAQLAIQRVRFLEGNIDAFRRHVDRLIELAPTDPAVLQLLSHLLIMIGDIERGGALLQSAAKLDVNPSAHRYMGEALLYLSQHDFVRARDAALRIDAPNWFVTHAFIAVTAGLAGNEALAHNAAKKLLALNPDFPAQARMRYRFLNFNPELHDLMLLGLHKAGIEVE